MPGMAVKPPRTALAGHTAGIFADMTLDGPEIGTLVAVVDRAKNLPNRKTMGKQDPYCAMRLGKEAKKTETDRRGGQTPKWDQELRFTVHDSPDYYRLKCSVFNDDKKTDLVGEAWIDLSDLVKPGGGSNDLWHQLNYKGKYAGDVRIELTYYDLRPREEKLSEKKKYREKPATPASDAAPAKSSPRQLGPREVRRRPLPPSPTATNTPVESFEQTQMPSVLQQEPPPVPPKVLPTREDTAWVTSIPPQQEPVQHTAPSYAEEALAIRPSAHHYRQPFVEEPSSLLDYPDNLPWNSPYTPPSDPNRPSPSSSMIPSSASLPSSSWQEETDLWDQSTRRRSQQIETTQEYHTPSRALPYPPGQTSGQNYHSARSNTSPVKPASYRDSPLRQSMNQESLELQLAGSPDAFDEPPPPPMHVETSLRKRQMDCPPSSFPGYDRSAASTAPRPTGMNSRRASIEERSPLQQIEQQYDAYSYSHDLDSSITRQVSQSSFEENQTSNHYQLAEDGYPEPERFSSYDEYQNHGLSHVSSDPYYQHGRSPPRSLEPSHHDHVLRGRRESYTDQYLDDDRIRTDEYYVANPRPQSHSQPDLSLTEYHKPTPIRPRPSDIDPNHKVQRKAISPGPSPVQDGRRLSGVPFNPDAYDVLNPASSPVTNEGTIFQTSEQARESARMREVEKLRDQGPIIGNDGRVIDPSDHLPSDTWAPEPERRQRRPEHVVHIRTKNDGRTRNKPSPGPTVSYPDPYRQLPIQQHSRSSPSTTPSSGGRNRLQKPAPSRPLPTQPHTPNRALPLARDGRANVFHPTSEPPPQRAMQRYSYHETSPTVHRPRLSEYQIAPSNNHVPRRSSFQDGYQFDVSQPRMQTGREYNPRSSDPYADPLAAEMSMIDIGPGRGGQMIVSRRGY